MSHAPMAPSASFMAQKRRKATAFRATSRLWGLLVNAMRQFTQSVKVVISVSVMKVEVVPHNLLDSVKRHAHNGLPFIAGCCCEDHEHGLPARLDVVHTRKDHLRTTPAVTANVKAQPHGHFRIGPQLAICVTGKPGQSYQHE